MPYTNTQRLVDFDTAAEHHILLAPGMITRCDKGKQMSGRM
jgi:hypothetical protein